MITFTRVKGEGGAGAAGLEYAAPSDKHAPWPSILPARIPRGVVFWSIAGMREPPAVPTLFLASHEEST